MKDRYYIIIILTVVVNSTCIGQINIGKIDSLLDKAYQQRQSCPGCAISDAKEVLRLCEKDPYSRKRAIAYKRIGMATRYQENFTEAIRNYQEAYRIDSISGYKLGQVVSLNLIGNVYKVQRKYDKAVETYIRSLKIGETIVVSDGDAYNSLAGIFSIRKEFDKAEGYFDKALKIREERKDTLRIAGTHQDLASLYVRMDSLDTALSHYTKSEELYKAIDNKDALGQLYNNVGGIYFKIGDNKNAIKYFKKSLYIKKELLNNRGVAITTYNICELYYNEKKYKQAIPYCDTSIVYAQPLKSYNVLSSAESILYQIAKTQNKHNKALNHLESYVVWNDSLNINNYVNPIKLMKAQVGKYEKDKELAEEREKNRLQEEKNRLQRIRYIIAILFTLIVVGGLTFYSTSKKKLHKEERKRRIKEEELRKESEKLTKETEGRRIEEQKLYKQVIKTLEKDAEIQAVNAEIDAKLQERTRVAAALHDSVCSGLVSAKMHMESVRKNIASEDKAVFARGFGLIDEAYNICREISHDLSPPMLAKFGLAPAIEDLCERLSTPQTQLQFNATPFEERLDHQQELTLYQSIQELLQNTLKHSAASEAQIQLTDYGDSLNILIEDDGKGFDIAEISDGGIGLQRISTRVKHLGGSMDVDSSPGNGTTVIIDVPKLLTSQNGSIS